MVANFIRNRVYVQDRRIIIYSAKYGCIFCTRFTSNRIQIRHTKRESPKEVNSTNKRSYIPPRCIIKTLPNFDAASGLHDAWLVSASRNRVIVKLLTMMNAAITSIKKKYVAHVRLFMHDLRMSMAKVNFSGCIWNEFMWRLPPVYIVL